MEHYISKHCINFVGKISKVKKLLGLTDECGICDGYVEGDDCVGNVFTRLDSIGNVFTSLTKFFMIVVICI